MKYGPETETIEAFFRYFKRMTPEQWNAAGYAAWDAAGNAAGVAARNAAWDAAWDAARDAAEYAAGNAANEIQGAALMRERGQPFYFLPLFGFADPEAVLVADKEQKDGV